ncbi:hypothetical protein QQ045_026611 [Rhodiola kirilowii]
MIETANSFMDVVVIATAGDEDDASSSRQPNRQRQRGSRGQNLLEDYFVDRPIFSEINFRRRYRMSSNLFNRIMTKLYNHDDYWHQRRDAAGVLGLLTEQKMTAAIRMLAYGSCADQCAELTRMGESTTLECLKKWCAQVVEHYKDRYLRSLNAADLSRLLQRAEQRGFSDIFDPLLSGICPQVTYKVNRNTYDAGYYLADGIYPKYSSFVKTIPNPQGDLEKLFAKKQESYHKDVERCFGILQSRWAIVRHAGMCHRKSVLKTIMLACIIMHNMIVEEEFIDDEFVEVDEEDPHNPRSAFTMYDGPTDQNGNRYLHDPVGRAQQSEAFGNRLTTLRSAYLHTELQNDLVKHNWFMETGEQL